MKIKSSKEIYCYATATTARRYANTHQVYYYQDETCYFLEPGLADQRKKNTKRFALRTLTKQKQIINWKCEEMTFNKCERKSDKKWLKKNQNTVIMDFVAVVYCGAQNISYHLRNAIFLVIEMEEYNKTDRIDFDKHPMQIFNPCIFINTKNSKHTRSFISELPFKQWFDAFRA